MLLLLFLSASCPASAIPKQNFNFFGLQPPAEAQESKTYCYTLDKDPYLFFSTKTAYEYTRGDLYNDQLPDSNQNSINAIPSARNRQHFSLRTDPAVELKPTRNEAPGPHGNPPVLASRRCPGGDQSKPRRGENVPLRGRLQTLEHVRERSAGSGEITEFCCCFRRWKWNASITQSRANDLVERGFMDLKGIGMRLKNRFPELVNDSCGGEGYYVSVVLQTVQKVEKNMKRNLAPLLFFLNLFFFHKKIYASDKSLFYICVLNLTESHDVLGT